MVEKDFYIAIHPGEVLSGILQDENIPQASLARTIGCSRKVISEICTGKRGISAEMAFKLGKAFNQSAEFWMTAQKNWELSQVNSSVARKVKRIVGLRAA
jgi:antitoxin HigA-1